MSENKNIEKNKEKQNLADIIINKIREDEKLSNRDCFNLGIYLGRYSQYMNLLSIINDMEKEKIKERLTDTNIMLIFSMFKIETYFDDIKKLREKEIKISDEKMAILSEMNKKIFLDILNERTVLVKDNKDKNKQKEKEETENGSDKATQDKTT